jgi:hypothetical protein
MIKDYEYLHGVVFSRLCNVQGLEISIRPYGSSGYSAYVLNVCAGLYIKYSTKRLTPWRFTMLKAHRDDMLEMKESFGEVFTALVCNLDGVVVLSFEELGIILGDIHETAGWISVSRRKRGMYSISGSSGRLESKVGLRSCPDKIVDYLASTPQK